jgi:hypothetical protein
MLSLPELRARIGAFTQPQKEKFPCSFFSEGLPRGALVEICGHGKREAVVEFLAENAQHSTAWIEKEFTLFPAAVSQREAALEKIFFIEGGKESAWAASAVLRSQLFPIVVYQAPYGEERELRRFQLLAEKSKSTMIFLSEKKLSLAWPIHLALEFKDGKAEVRKKKA